MVLLASIILLQGASLVGSMPGLGAVENITVMFLSPTAVRVFWETSIDSVDKYDVTFKPTDARVIEVVAGNSEAVTLNNLQPDTQYQVTVTALRSGKKYKSRPVVFRTMEPPQSSPHQQEPQQVITPDPVNDAANEVSNNPDHPNNLMPQQQYTQVRGVEVGIVILVLIVWGAAIALFFNRWGKIRMLLPYQPDYKEQLKVPGGATCGVNGGVTCPGQTHTVSSCPQGCCCNTMVQKCLNIYPRRPTQQLERDCGCQFALLHRAVDS